MAYKVKFNNTNQYSVKGKSTNQSLNAKFQNTQTINGLSAYEVAVKNGFEGTEQEWLDSLQGEPGVDGLDGSDGQNGEDGRDGVSPKVDVQTIEGGHRVTVTDETGSKTFDVMDGKKGDKGDNADNDEVFVVRQTGNGTADKTYSEVAEAIRNGRAALFVDTTGIVYPYAGYYSSDDGIAFAKMRNGLGGSKGLYESYYTVNSQNEWSYNRVAKVDTPNPYKLTFTGAASGTYDGSQALTVNIPEGGTGSEATKELFVVNWFEEGGVIKSDCRAGDIRKAAAEGKLPVLFNWDGKVYIYSHDAVHTNVHPTNKLPTFVSAMEYEPGVLSYKISVVTQTSEICMFGYSKVRTQTPKKLTFTGAVEATFDGGEAITVNIPESGVDEEQLDQAVQEALQEAKDSGLFDGKDGKDGIDGKDGKDGYTPVKGKDYFDGQPGSPGADGADGKDGVDGFSPTVSVSKTGKTTTISITDKNGTKTAEIKDGEDGQDAEGGGGTGLPTGGEPHQMLVTDAEGNAKWEERTHYSETEQAAILSEAESFVFEAGQFGVVEPVANQPTAGNMYTVSYGSSVYELEASDYDMEGMSFVGMGNPVFMGGEDNGLPLFLMFVPPDMVEGFGGMTVMIITSGLESMPPISVSGTIEKVHKIDKKYLPVIGASYLVNGSALGSVRNISTYSEDEEYEMGEGAVALSGRARGMESFAVGGDADATGDQSFAHAGIATGAVSFAANGATASGERSFAANAGEASGRDSAAFCWLAKAKGIASFAEGWQTIAAGKNQHAQGRYNIEDTANKYAHIVGNGDGINRSNAHTIDWDGNGWFAGVVKVGGTGQDDATAKELATKEYVASVFEQLKELILAGDTAGAVAVLDQAILDNTILA